MSRETEKIFKQLMQYMEEHQDELDDGVDEKKLEYLSKALELEPDNLDAARMLAEVNAKNPEDLLEALSSLIEKGNSSMEKEGYFQDCMGDFWGVLETRTAPLRSTKSTTNMRRARCCFPWRCCIIRKQILKPVCSISAVWPRQTRTQRSSCG